MKDIVEAVRVMYPGRIAKRIAEQVAHPVPQVVEQIIDVEVIRLIPQEFPIASLSKSSTLPSGRFENKSWKS